jgi:hypothetical protein
VDRSQGTSRGVLGPVGVVLVVVLWLMAVLGAPGTAAHNPATRPAPIDEETIDAVAAARRLTPPSPAPWTPIITFGRGA